MLLNILIFVLLHRVFSNDDLCRLIEFDVPENFSEFHSDQIEEKLFYKTDYVCQSKPVFHSLKHSNIYQFQSPNNRWWMLYNTTNSTYKLGMREWCDAWNMKPLLAMPLGMFQHPLGKSKRLQRWQRVIVHEKNNSYTYKSISNVHLKCYYPPSTSNCQTEQLSFLFDLTETTNDDEFHQMKLLTKTLIWLLYNQTNIALSYYHDTFHLVYSFNNRTSSKSLEHVFDSIDAMNKQLDIPKRSSVRWPEAIHGVATQIFRRRLLLPFSVIHLPDVNQSLTNDSSAEDDNDVYTEPYPLIYSDDDAVKTILNITTYREKRSIKTKYDKSNHVLVILTSRSKYLYDYKQRDRRLARFIASVPLRILVIDFSKLSNKKLAEYVHSAFIHNAKYALVSPPATYNYIETYEDLGDAIYGNQLFNHYQRLCRPTDEKLSIGNFTTTLIETLDSSTTQCSLLTLFDSQDTTATLKDTFDYMFYQTPDRCFSAPVYRSLGSRNLYVQRIANGRWLIIHVDPLLPSTMTMQQKLASTTTSTWPPEFLYATDYANDPIVNDHINLTSLHDQPISIPHCSNTPGLDILWESDGSSPTNEYSLRTPHQWLSTVNQTDIITPICNKYQISCQTIKYDFLIVIDSHREYSSLIQTFLNIFLTLIEPFLHRFSLIVLSSTTTDTFQYHLPLTTINTRNNRLIESFLSYTDSEMNSIVQLNQHLQRASEYLITNQQTLSDIPSQQVIITLSSRLNFNRKEMENIIQRYSTIRFMTLDPYLRTDDDNQNHQERERFLQSLTSSPSYANIFWSYAANRDLTFNTVFRILESLCGYLR